MTATTTKQAAEHTADSDCPDWCRSNHQDYRVHVGGERTSVTAGREGSVWTRAIKSPGSAAVIVLSGQDYPQGLGQDEIRDAKIRVCPRDARGLADLLDMLADAEPGDVRALAAAMRRNAAHAESA